MARDWFSLLGLGPKELTGHRGLERYAKCAPSTPRSQCGTAIVTQVDTHGRTRERRSEYRFYDVAAYLTAAIVAFASASYPGSLLALLFALPTSMSRLPN
jgi:hypothetical protein